MAAGLGDIIYAFSSTVWKRLVGNTTTTVKYLTSIGSGSAATAPTWRQPAESDLAFTDITTNNVSTTKHGFVPKAPNDSGQFLDGTGAWSAPPGGSGGTVTHTGGLTANQLVLGNGTADIKPLGAAGTATQVLHGNASGVPSFGAVVEGDLGLTDITTANVSTSAHGFAPKAPNDATKFLDGTAAYDTVKDSDLSTSDITTNNVSTSKHGFTPKLPNDATKYLDGTGAYSTPVGTGGTASSYAVKTSDQNVNNSTTLVNDTELLFPVSANTTYEFDLYALVSAPDVTADFKVQWTVPASATLYWGPDMNATSVSYWGLQGTSTNALTLRRESDSALQMAANLATSVTGMHIHGIVRTAGTSGNVQFQWAQDSAFVGNNTVKADSYIKYRAIR